MSMFIQPLITCTNLQSITLDGVIYTKLQIGYVLRLPELCYLYLDISLLGQRQTKMIDYVLAKRYEQLKTLCLKDSTRTNSLSILNDVRWRRLSLPADLRFVFNLSFPQDYGQLSTLLSEYLYDIHPHRDFDTYVSVYNQVCGKELLQLQYRISQSQYQSRVTLLSCSDMQLSVAWL